MPIADAEWQTASSRRPGRRRQTSSGGSSSESDSTPHNDITLNDDVIKDWIPDHNTDHVTRHRSDDDSSPDSSSTDSDTEVVTHTVKTTSTQRPWKILGNDSSHNFKEINDLAIGLSPNAIVVSEENYIKIIDDSDTRQFRSGIRISGIAVNSEGNIIVTNPRRNSVGIYRQDGSRIHEFGKKGHGDGQFVFPHSVAVGGDDRIYVTDHDLGRVSVHRPNGKFLHHIGKQRLKKPTSVAVSQDRVVVADQRLNGIVVFDLSGAVLHTLGDTRLKHARGLCVTRHGDVYVGNNDASWRRVDVFDEHADHVTSIENVNEQFGSIQALAMIETDQDDNHQLIVADSKNHTITIFKVK